MQCNNKSFDCQICIYKVESANALVLIHRRSEEAFEKFYYHFALEKKIIWCWLYVNHLVTKSFIASLTDLNNSRINTTK